jgi:nucleotide-binding universal stress UspA family protein
LVTAPALWAGAPSGYGLLAESIADYVRRLGEQVGAYGHLNGVDVTFVHIQGDTAEEVLRIANADHADLLVVGRSTKARHRITGSMARRLIGRRGAPIVVVVP